MATAALPDPARVVRPPQPLKATEWDALWDHGGYPEPFLKRDPRFSRRWQALRREQLLQEEIRDLTRIHQLDQLAVLVRLLADRSAQQLVYGNLAREVRVAQDTVRSGSRHSAISISVPAAAVVSECLPVPAKEPKWFLRDWASLRDAGARAETFVACHLLKAVEGWTDLGLGVFELGYLRDKDKRKVDFVVARDGAPWFLVEVKRGDAALSPSLRFFQKPARRAVRVQVALDAEYVDRDCFARPAGPVIVPGPNAPVTTSVAAA